MTTFVLRRLIWTIPVLLIVILFTFLLMRQIKGNPFRKTERAVPASILQNLERKYHLNRPWYVQYAYYVKGVFTFDLGPSLVLRNQDVNDIVRQHFPVSVAARLLRLRLRGARRDPARRPLRAYARTRSGTTAPSSSATSASPCRASSSRPC